MLRVFAGVVVQSALFALLILGSGLVFGGSLAWPRGLLAVSVVAAVSLVGAVWFQKTDPDLARERASAPEARTPADAWAMLAIVGTVIAWFLFVSWDVHRRHLPTLDPSISVGLGLLLFLAGVGAIVWTFRVNSFAVTVVRVQEDRAQRVIETGPYALVRHPMYAGAIAFFAGLGLILGSAVGALIAVPVFALAFIPRILVEEAVLRRDLIGYADYQARVRSRLLPGLL
jgi:protein-S-isoprenylcysteine O-methyltransferase Ste14